MKIIEKVNELYQNEFKKRRLQLITEWGANKVEALEKIKIIDFFDVGDREQYIGFRFELETDGFNNVFEGTSWDAELELKTKNGTVVFEEEESNSVYEWFFRRIMSYTDVRAKERWQAKIDEKFQQANELHTGLKIICVERVKNGFVYHLEKGEKIIIEMEMK